MAHQRLFAGTIIGISALVWLALWLWALSPYARYLDHGDWTKIGTAGAICTASPGSSFVFPALLYVGGWLLMLIAMMLPTALPMFEVYRHATVGRADQTRLLTAVIVGYLTAWCVFGSLAHGLDFILHKLGQSSDWLIFNGWAIGVGVFAVAGAFQFTGLKDRCLEQCRTPISFLMKYWSTRADGLLPAFRLGWTHGLFCVGCCWAIMLLMFVVGTGNVGWMLVLGAVMALEKNSRWGKYLSAPLGCGLLLCALGIALWNVRLDA
jgi:predicted metal-binding membrane protein